METLSNLQNWLLAGPWVPTRNFYYERHPCQTQGEVSVPLDTVVKDEKTNKVIRLGVCPHCQTLFYHEDYEDQPL